MSNLRPNAYEIPSDLLAFMWRRIVAKQAVKPPTKERN
jgi:hypothetical protein